MGDTGVFTTRAEGLDRRGFTLADVEKVIAAGILDSDEKFELIDGCGPGSEAWANAAQVSFGDPLEALFLPGAQVRAAEFGG